MSTSSCIHSIQGNASLGQQVGVNFTCRCNAGLEGDGKKAYKMINSSNTSTGASGCTNINYCKYDSCWGGMGFNSLQRLSACSDLTPKDLPKKFTCASCPSGYVGDGVKCSDKDDCGSKPCGKGSCTDKGTNVYDCKCPKGYTQQGSANQMKNTCVRVDMCAADEDDCVGSATCNHVGPSVHTCTCPAGTEGDGTNSGSKCSDINGCKNSPCSSLVTCSDVSAPNTGFTCSKCPTGYQGNAIGSNGCTDIDACANNPCPVLSGKGTAPACTDLKAPSLQYTCAACPTGYDSKAVTKNNKLTCIDTNMCLNGPCHKVANCLDQAAPQTGFSCTCPSGYSGNGVGSSGCADINDCAKSPCGTKTGISCKYAGPTRSRTCTCPSSYKSLGNSQKPKSAWGCVQV